MSESNKDLRKKLRERFFLERFCAAARQPLQIVAERETPDFILRDACGEHGVELAELFKDRRPAGANGKLASPGREGESRRTDYLRQVSGEYYRQGGRPLSVQALFIQGVEFPSPQEVVRQLLVHRPSEEMGRCRIEVEEAATFFLCALPQEYADYAHWTPVNNHGGWRSRNRLEDLQEVIRQKSSKLARCREVRKRVALLIHADGTRGSGMVTWRADFAPIDPCGFDEVLLYLHPGAAWRLWPSPAEELSSQVAGHSEESS